VSNGYGKVRKRGAMISLACSMCQYNGGRGSGVGTVGCVRSGWGLRGVLSGKNGYSSTMKCWGEHVWTGIKGPVSWKGDRLG